MTGAVRLPTPVSRIISRLNDNGYEAYVVGGCVRDCIMNKQPVDWDITTSALPQQIKRLFPRTHDTGIAHGTVTVVQNNVNYEVTTFRIDGEYRDGRHPAHVDFTASLQEDLRRRDFTMNAIAWHEAAGEYIDPFGGMADIAARVIRGVGEADARFKEDALRMLRAIRFSAKLDFAIEPATWRALLDNAPLIQQISLERVRDELLGLLESPHPEKITLLAESRLMTHIDPALGAHLRAFDPAPLALAAPDAILRMAILLRGLDGTKQRLKFFRMDNQSVAQICSLVTEAQTPLVDDFTHIRRRLSKAGIETVRLLIQLFEAYGGDLSGVRAKLETILSRGDCISMRMLAVGGEDLKKLGITDGRAIGHTLNELLDHVLQKPADNTPALLTYFAERVHKVIVSGCTTEMRGVTDGGLERAGIASVYDSHETDH